MSKKVIIMHFDLESQAYQAFSEIKRLAAERKVVGEQMAVVTHTSDGAHQFKIDDFIDFTGSDHTSKNSLIGMVIGILGGPLGVLLGWFTGSLIGATQDAKEIQDATSVFEHVTAKIGEGETGLILIAKEEDNRPLNQLIVNELDGEISRLDLTDVESEITNAKKTENEAKDSAKKSWKEKRQEKKASENQ